MLISKFILTNGISQKSLPKLQFYLTSPGRNENYISLLLYKDFSCIVELDFLFPTVSGFNFTQ